MKQGDIMEARASAIENKIFSEWKHEGFIDGCGATHINFYIDEKEYVLRLFEVKEGEHWSEVGVNNTDHFDIDR